MNILNTEKVGKQAEASTEKAKKMNFLIPLALLLGAARLCVGQTRPCRRSEEITRCVESPISEEEGRKLCPYRVCGFSYIGADKCGEDFDTRATHMCQNINTRKSVWKCIAGIEHRRMLQPLGCEGTECTNEQKACFCKTEVVDRVIRLQGDLITEPCPLEL